MANEVENLIKEADEWITEKKDAIRMIVLLWSKFSLKPQDIIDEYKERLKLKEV